ncbi:MAG: lipopolysaccharide heptosyltransferase I [Gammaproteobacteria bacterium]
MKLLLIKTSSLGDVIHTLPAITDAVERYPQLEITWVIEESFVDIASMHPQVKHIIPVAWRKWRKRWWRLLWHPQWQNFIKTLRLQHYDYVIDAQGLLKSAFFSVLARGPRYGLNWQSAREPLASWFYQHKLAVAKGQHAITRVRQLFANVLNYSEPNSSIDYGLQQLNFANNYYYSQPYLIFLHGTTWATKHWPESYWQQLIVQATTAGYYIILPWGNQQEQARAQRLAHRQAHVQVLPEKFNFMQLASLIKHAAGVVAVDTGLGHLAAALATPCISLYGPTNPALTGSLGVQQIHLKAQFACAPCLSKRCHYKLASEIQPACFETITPQYVWQQLTTAIDPAVETVT